MNNPHDFPVIILAGPTICCLPSQCRVPKIDKGRFVATWRKYESDKSASRVHLVLPSTAQQFAQNNISVPLDRDKTIWQPAFHVSATINRQHTPWLECVCVTPLLVLKVIDIRGEELGGVLLFLIYHSSDPYAEISARNFFNEVDSLGVKR